MAALMRNLGGADYNGPTLTPVLWSNGKRALRQIRDSILMHYEKKGFDRASLNKLAKKYSYLVFLMVAIILWLYVHAPSEFWWPIKFIDVINVIAQIATALAFLFAVHQYRKNKESERQKVLVEESRALINKLKAEANAFCSLPVVTVKSSVNFMNLASGHAGNFDAIFKELNEDIHKAIVRMHWHDMYFVDMNRAMEHFNKTMSLGDFCVSQETLSTATRQASILRSTGTEPLSGFEDYLKLQYQADLPAVSKELKVDKEARIAMFVFEKLFFDNEALKDHLHGCMNKIDIRIRSPLLAVLNERCMTGEIRRDTSSYKQFYYLKLVEKAETPSGE
ncbi:hypothetical protein [Pseudomonas sp. UV AK001]|uniref:hypothetical protein n=1 Tax=Pseudomonas sp. UV AK001 TaxID=3384791 RepID=UPI0038D3867D